MGIVTRNRGLPQIRCKTIAADQSSLLFRYEVNVMGRWMTCNDSFARWVVESGWWLFRQEGA